jgi:hypothetical protein
MNNPNSTMTNDDILKLAKRRPFRSFSVTTSDGMTYQVDDPLRINCPEDGRALYFFAPTGEVIILDAISITTVVE